jgi:hypothetical protein
VAPLVLVWVARVHKRRLTKDRLKS